MSDGAAPIELVDITDLPGGIQGDQGDPGGGMSGRNEDIQVAGPVNKLRRKTELRNKSDLGARVAEGHVEVEGEVEVVDETAEIAQVCNERPQHETLAVCWRC
ncbi:hypothetical protein J3R83DRAFT_5802 [Lanmaoa asiatica]|nr:hypothetical protein J3R83DRAFT_5802 [Lanmaoa asiatica]